MLSRLNNLSSLQASLIIVVVGFVMFFSGLATPFKGDDIPQIVDNVPAHSITNIAQFFNGGTFYSGPGIPLTGNYYRPLMTTTFSLLYTVFGPHPVYFHLVQLSLFIGGVILLYQFFKLSFKPGLALLLALFFLVHPINSQVVYSIPSMQDALFFFFGMLGMWLLFRFESVRSLVAVALCLFVSLLAKEAAFLFVAMALVYLFFWDRKRLLTFLGILSIPLILYFALRINAIGFFGPKPENAPIAQLGLFERLLTAPSIAQFYITKLLFPAKLATAYYWTYTGFSFQHTVIPLFVDLLALALAAYGGVRLRRQASKTSFYIYCYFFAWMVIGVGLALQVLPVDMTASESWFLFAFVGLLGMIGIIVSDLPLKIRLSKQTVAILVVVLLTVLGVRTAIRGTDYQSEYKLSKQDILASKEHHGAYSALGKIMQEQGRFSESKEYIERSIEIHPNYNNYLNLGATLTKQGEYSEAMEAYKQCLSYGVTISVYKNLGLLALVHGDYASNRQLLLKGLEIFPRDSNLWMYLAILDDKNNNNNDAQIAIQRAASYGQIPEAIHFKIMNNQPYTLSNFINPGNNLIIDKKH